MISEVEEDEKNYFWSKLADKVAEFGGKLGFHHLFHDLFSHLDFTECFWLSNHGFWLLSFYFIELNFVLYCMQLGSLWLWWAKTKKKKIENKKRLQNQSKKWTRNQRITRKNRPFNHSLSTRFTWNSETKLTY